MISFWVYGAFSSCYAAGEHGTDIQLLSMLRKHVYSRLLTYPSRELTHAYCIASVFIPYPPPSPLHRSLSEHERAFFMQISRFSPKFDPSHFNGKGSVDAITYALRTENNIKLCNLCGSPKNLEPCKSCGVK